MRKSNRRKKPDKSVKKYRTNAQIKAEEVRLIDETGEHVGVISYEDALNRAQEEGLDLVEIEPTAKPPVCKLIDHGKFQYEQEKLRKKAKAKQKQSETKGIRLSLRIGDHDRQVRMKQATKFLNQGHEVKIEMVLRGRERGHKDLAVDIIKDFITRLKEEGELPIEWGGDINRQGGRMHTIIGLKK